ncbi:MAG TPA: hypothetical protein VF179_29570, partial [Thermoanaerobaculia bacterium]|nr:hypothetical protein [Thermoanaerobaculia bacterium]
MPRPAKGRASTPDALSVQMRRLRAVSNCKSEEDVKVKFLLPYLRDRGYKDACVRFEEAIKVQEGRKEKTIFADAVVYASPKSKAPLVLCETKA